MKVQVLAMALKAANFPEVQTVQITQEIMIGDRVELGFTAAEWEGFEDVVGAFMPAHHIVETAPNFVFVVFNF